MSDRIFGGLGILLAGFYIWQATLIQESFIQDPIGPKTFPVIIAIVLAVSGLVMLVQPDAEPIWPSAGRFFEVIMATAVMIAYAMLLSRIGFVISTALATAYLSWRLGASAVGAVVSGISIAIAIYVIFHLVLGLSIARGPFGF